MSITLNDKTLFGNDAAEDEDQDIFESYAVERSEVGVFLDDKRSLAVVRAYKGEGKSALLRLVGLRLKSRDPAPLVITLSASSISPDLENADSDKWVRNWKASFLKYAAGEIGASISMAWTDSATALVEEAEASGFKERSFVSSILDRLKVSGVRIEHNRIPPANYEKTLKRWAENGSNIWFIVDDVDQNFENSAKNKLKVASFFVAIRQIANQIPEFRFRTAIRPNVWSIVKREYEALSHIEQYMADLKWSKEDYYQLLAKRVEGYLHRTGQWDKERKTLDGDIYVRNKQLIAKVFEDPMPWGIERTRPPAVILHTLSRQRPRWLVELGRVAAGRAIKNGHDQITFSDINNELEAFGKRRVDDTIAEFHSQCEDVEKLIVAFVGQPEWFATADLMSTITDRVLQAVKPKIIGVMGTPAPREVAHFLFQIGFLTARKNEPNGDYHHLAFSDNPSLLSSTTNLDQGYSWEIHPVFRQALKLKNVQDKKQAV